MAEMEDSNSGIPPPPTNGSASSGTIASFFSETIMNTNTNTNSMGGIPRPPALTMPPPASFPVPGVFSRTKVSPLFRNFTPRLGLARPLRPSRLSAEDDAAVEAAVEIGFLLSQCSQSEADLLLQTLHKEGNLNIFGSSNTPKMGAIGRG